MMQSTVKVGGVDVTAGELDEAIYTLRNVHPNVYKIAEPLRKVHNPLSECDYHGAIGSLSQKVPFIVQPNGRKQHDLPAFIVYLEKTRNAYQETLYAGEALLFGEISGYGPGAWWPGRKELAASGVHIPLVESISGSGVEGADSVVVRGSEGEEDNGDELMCSGQGDVDPETGKQTHDQQLDHPGNAGLVTSQLRGLPVRVVRSSQSNGQRSQKLGYRYDGLYRVSDHWSSVGESGFRLWRFRLVRLSTEEEIPFVPEVNLPPGHRHPKTSRGIVTRVIRSTEVSRSIKMLYDDTCQVCGTRLDVPGGAISEGAHIRALGGPQFGPDVPENVLCLCPNHHAMFDNGGIYVDDDLTVRDHHDAAIGNLHVAISHSVSSALEYHRANRGH